MEYHRHYFLLFRFVTFLTFILLLFSSICSLSSIFERPSIKLVNESQTRPTVYVWCCVTNLQNNYSRPILRNFQVLLKSLLRTSPSCQLSINIVYNKQDKISISNSVSKVEFEVGHSFYEILFHDSAEVFPKFESLARIMMPYFTLPNLEQYYHRPEFYMYVGLYKVAPEYQQRVIFLDIDLKFRDSIAGLYDHFSRFGPHTLFGIGRELSPEYFRVLRKWANLTTQFNPTWKKYSGLNAGVVLLDLQRIRQSDEWRQSTEPKFIEYLSKKYDFKGYLGSQDFFTLLELEKPHLFHILPCTWNRPLSLMWKDTDVGVSNQFQYFFRCDGRIHVYHGNNGYPIPDD